MTIWLSEVAAALRPLVDHGFGVLAYQVDHTAAQRFAHVVSAGARVDPLLRSVPYLPPALFRAIYTDIPRLTWAADHVIRTATRHALDPSPFLAVAARDYGYDDILALSVPLGDGPVLQLTAPGPRRPLPAVERRLLLDLCGHLQAAVHLRRRARTEAVLDPAGRLLHAEGDARAADARAALSDAVRRTETARGRLRRTAPAEAAALWDPVVAGRWTVVEQFDVDGKRFLLARRPTGLTPREQQVTALVASGASNKEIAHALGLAPSTVSGALRAALRKLGLRHRLELVR
ncbi:MAG: LuxR C-terminal-related transcriptional regulator [Myxococcota bacterium]